MTMWTKKGLIAGAAWVVITFGCATGPDNEAEYEGQTQDSAMLTPQERTDRRQALSREWQDVRTKIDELRAKTEADGVENEWDQTVAKIDREASDLSRQLDEFGDESREAWNDFEARVQSGLDSMDREIDQAVESME